MGNNMGLCCVREEGDDDIETQIAELRGQVEMWRACAAGLDAEKKTLDELKRRGSTEKMELRLQAADLTQKLDELADRYAQSVTWRMRSSVKHATLTKKASMLGVGPSSRQALPSMGACSGKGQANPDEIGGGTDCQDIAMSAKAFFNNMLQTALPGVIRGVEDILIRENHNGGMPLYTHGKDKDPVYSLRILKSGSPDLQQGDVIKKLSLQVYKLRAVAAAHTRDTSTLPEEVRTNAREVIMIDCEVEWKVDFRQDDGSDSNIEFQIHGDQWWSPTLGAVHVNTIEARAYLRVWYGLSLHKMLIAFLEEPDVKWEIEASLLGLGIPLLDAVEDDFASWSVRKVLSMRDSENPIEVYIKSPFPDGADKPGQDASKQTPKDKPSL